MSYPKLSFRVGLARGFTLGPGKIDLLQAIDHEGSISKAARALGMSYRRAWLLVDDLNRGFGFDLVTTSMGGAAGGGAALTPDGEKVLAAYLAIGGALKRSAARPLQALARLAAEPVKTKLRPPRPHLGKAPGPAAKRGRKKAS